MVALDVEIVYPPLCHAEEVQFVFAEGSDTHVCRFLLRGQMRVQVFSRAFLDEVVNDDRRVADEISGVTACEWCDVDVGDLA